MGSSPNHSAEDQITSPEAIDASARWPVLLLFGTAILWLVLALVFGAISSIKMHAPGFIANCSWMTYGHVRAAYFDLLIYGFASPAGLGFALWSLARLGRVPLALPGLASAGALVWNVGVVVGLFQVLAGQSTGFAWMEFPRHAAAILLGGFFAITVAAFYTLRDRVEHELYPSQWFIAGALFVFPWLVTVGYFLAVISPLRGVAQFIVASWFANGLLYIWLIPLALAAAYYLLPKVTGRPLYSGQSAFLGFWVLFFFGSWSASNQLILAPAPRWIGSAAAAAKLVLIVTAACYATNWLLTAAGKKKGNSPNSVGAFLAFGSFALVTGIPLDAIGSLKPLATRVAFTPYAIGVTQWLLLGFVVMVLTGGIYYIVQRLLGNDALNGGRARLHFFLTATGVLLVAFSSMLGGLSFGGALGQPEIPFATASKGLTPFLGLASLGFMALIAGQLLFATNFLAALFKGTARERSEFCHWCCDESVTVGRKSRARA